MNQIRIDLFHDSALSLTISRFVWRTTELFDGFRSSLIIVSKWIMYFWWLRKSIWRMGFVWRIIRSVGSVVNVNGFVWFPNLFDGWSNDSVVFPSSLNGIDGGGDWIPSLGPRERLVQTERKHCFCARKSNGIFVWFSGLVGQVERIVYDILSHDIVGKYMAWGKWS